MTVQMIYYPGFALGGISEPLAAIATLVLMLLLRDRGVAFWWASAFLALVSMHAIFWCITQPVNRHWLKTQQLGTAGTKFFALDRAISIRKHSIRTGNVFEIDGGIHTLPVQFSLRLP